MPSVPPGARDWSFYDNAPAAMEKVDAAKVDIELDDIWSSHNALLTALATTIRNDNQLEDEIVRLRCLHPEVLAEFVNGASYARLDIPNTFLDMQTFTGLVEATDPGLVGVTLGGGRLWATDRLISPRLSAPGNPAVNLRLVDDEGISFDAGNGELMKLSSEIQAMELGGDSPGGVGLNRAVHGGGEIWLKGGTNYDDDTTGKVQNDEIRLSGGSGLFGWSVMIDDGSEQMSQLEGDELQFFTIGKAEFASLDFRTIANSGRTTLSVNCDDLIDMNPGTQVVFYGTAPSAPVVAGTAEVGGGDMRLSGNVQPKNVAYIWPAAAAVGLMISDASGNLSWSNTFPASLTIGSTGLRFINVQGGTGIGEGGYVGVSTLAKFGNYSAIMGGAYDSNSLLYSAGTHSVVTGGITLAMTTFGNGMTRFYGAGVTSTPASTVTLGGGNVCADAYVQNSNIRLAGNDIREYSSASNTASIRFNQYGYADGSSYFRSLAVYNGKTGLLAFFDGASGFTRLAGTILSADAAASMIVAGGGEMRLAGNIKPKNVAYDWPAAAAVGVLTCDVSGNLSWAAGGGGGISGTLTSGRIPYASGASTLTDSSDLTWSAGTLRVGSAAATSAFLTSTSIVLSDTVRLNDLTISRSAIDQWKITFPDTILTVESLGAEAFLVFNVQVMKTGLTGYEASVGGGAVNAPNGVYVGAYADAGLDGAVLAATALRFERNGTTAGFEVDEGSVGLNTNVDFGISVGAGKTVSIQNDGNAFFVSVLNGAITTNSTADGAITTAGKITAKAAVPASFADLAAVRTYLASILT